MNYLPRHAAPSDHDEWDGTDPLTSLEDSIDRKYAKQDSRTTTLAATNRENRKWLRDVPRQVRRTHMALRGYPEHMSREKFLANLTTGIPQNGSTK